MRHRDPVVARAARDGPVGRGLRQARSDRVDNGPELTAGAFEVLDARLFNAASEVQAADDWRTDYNEYRPHDSSGSVPPAVVKPTVFNQ